MNDKQRKSLQKLLKELEKTLRHYEAMHKKFPATREDVEANPAFDDREALRDVALMFADMPSRIEDTKRQISDLKQRLGI